MKTFMQWMEAMYSMDLSKLEGDPYITTEWGNYYDQYGKPWLQVKLTYRWKGYQVLPHQLRYAQPAKPDEFGSIELEQDRDNIKYFYVVGSDIATPFRRQGYGTELYRKAVELVKSRGFAGIRSSKYRSNDANKLWASFADRTQDAEWDYLHM